jgi:hypothetical protein
MSITINGSGSITGLVSGGLPDGSVTAADLADTYLTPTGDGSGLTGISSFGGSWSSTSVTSGVTYTNTSGSYQFINCYIGAINNLGRSTGQVTGYVDGTERARSASRGYGNQISDVTLIVPPNSTWSFDLTGSIDNGENGSTSVVVSGVYIFELD